MACPLLTQAWDAFFEANRRKGVKPGSEGELLSDRALLQRITDAHLIAGKQLFQWVSSSM